MKIDLKNMNRPKILMISVLCFSFAFTATAAFAALTFTNDDVTSDEDITITGVANAANSIYLHANGGTSETILVRADQGTSVTEGAASVELLSDVGGVELRSTANLANAIALTSDGGTTGTILVYNDQGTSVTEGAESIALVSDAGGVGLRSTANLARAI